MRWIDGLLCLASLHLFMRAAAAADLPPLVGDLTYERTYSGVLAGSVYSDHYSGQLTVQVHNIVMVAQLPNADAQGRQVHPFSALYHTPPVSPPASPPTGSGQASVQGTLIDDHVPVNPQINCERTDTQSWAATSNDQGWAHGGNLSVTLSPDGSGTAELHWSEPADYSVTYFACNGSVSQHSEYVDPVDMPHVQALSPATGTAHLDPELLTVKIRWTKTTTLTPGLTITENLSADFMQAKECGAAQTQSAPSAGPAASGSGGGPTASGGATAANPGGAATGAPSVGSQTPFTGPNGVHTFAFTGGTYPLESAEFVYYTSSDPAGESDPSHGSVVYQAVWDMSKVAPSVYQLLKSRSVHFDVFDNTNTYRTYYGQDPDPEGQGALLGFEQYGKTATGGSVARIVIFEQPATAPITQPSGANAVSGSILRSQSPQEVAETTRHEIGHMLDDLSSAISQKPEFQGLATGDETWFQLFDPTYVQDQQKNNYFITAYGARKYSPGEGPWRELFAQEVALTTGPSSKESMVLDQLISMWFQCTVGFVDNLVKK